MFNKLFKMYTTIIWYMQLLISNMCLKYANMHIHKNYHLKAFHFDLKRNYLI